VGVLVGGFLSPANTPKPPNPQSPIPNYPLKLKKINYNYI
jgi:hypothetical protein